MAGPDLQKCRASHEAHLPLSRCSWLASDPSGGRFMAAHAIVNLEPASHATGTRLSPQLLGGPPQAEHMPMAGTALKHWCATLAICDEHAPAGKLTSPASAGGLSVRISAAPRLQAQERAGSAPLAASPGAHDLPDAYTEGGAASEYTDGDVDGEDDGYEDEEGDLPRHAAPEERAQRASQTLTTVAAY